MGESDGVGVGVGEEATGSTMTIMLIVHIIVLRLCYTNGHAMSLYSQMLISVIV